MLRLFPIAWIFHFKLPQNRFAFPIHAFHSTSSLHSSSPKDSTHPPPAKESTQPSHSPQKIIIQEQDLEENFVKGSGAGGQKINKTSSCVQLKHIPTGIMIETQRFRSLADNRREARKLLAQKLDTLVNGDQSKMARKIAKLQKQKQKQKQRAKKKYSKD